MSSTGAAKSSMQRRGLAMLVAGALLLGASGPTPAASPLDSNVSGSDVIALGAKAGIASGQNITAGSDVITLGAKLGIAGGTSIAEDGTVVALGVKLGLSGGSSSLAPSGEEIPQRV
jgi:hypothetical protein